MTITQYTDEQLAKVNDAADALILTMSEFFVADTPAAFLANALAQVMVAQNRHCGDTIRATDVAQAAVAAVIYATPPHGHMTALATISLVATQHSITLAAEGPG